MRAHINASRLIDVGDYIPIITRVLSQYLQNDTVAATILQVVNALLEEERYNDDFCTAVLRRVIT